MALAGALGGRGLTVALEVIALDLMGTVVRDPYREALRAATSLPLEELLARRDPTAWPRFERGEITEEEHWELYGGLPFDVDAFHRARRQGYAFVPGMDRLLAALQGRVLRVAATNYPVWVRELEDGLLRGCFEQVVASTDLGVRKPDPRFFRDLCARVAVEPTRMLFVDDRADNVDAARAAGLPAHVFLDAEDLWARLPALGLDLDP
jgi:FMN hydrolase / 5-amino-6-(5-phospho-D-ribitylamino)uracil phosphatase